MSAPCPVFGFIIHAATGEDAGRLGRVLRERLAATGLVVTEDRRSPEVVITREGTQATDGDRQLVIALLADDPSAVGATMSDLVDLSY